MKIGFYGIHAVRSTKTGIETYAASLLPALQALPQELEMLLLVPNGVGQENLPSGIDIAPLRSSNKWFWMLKDVPSILRANKVEVFFNPGSYTFLGDNSRTVVTIHDVAWKYFPEYFPAFKRVLFDLMHKHVGRVAKKLIAVSQCTKNDLVRYYGIAEEKIEVVHHGVDATIVSEGPKKQEDDAAKLKELLGGNFPYFLYVGTLQKRKNIIKLIQAFNGVKEPDLKLVLAGGKGWFWQEIYSEIDRSPKKKDIILTGYIDDAAKMRLYRNATMFVLPSLYEGFGLPVLEAMACGAPVITSSDSSLGEVAGDAARTIDPSSVDDLRAAMSEMAGDAGMREAFKTKGFDRVKEFSWQACAEKTLRVFQGVAEQA